MEKEISLTYYGYVVAYIDVLGQKDKLMKYLRLPNNNDKEYKDAFKRNNKETALVIKHLRDAFNMFFQKSPSGDVYISNGIKIQFITDGVLIYLSLANVQDYGGTLKQIKDLLSSCGILHLHMLSQNTALRGGIELGAATELEEGDIYGPAVAWAHHLESKIATYPRIVIGNGLIDYLKICRHDNTLINDIKCLDDMLVSDDDGYTILDWLGGNELNKKLFNNKPDDFTSKIIKANEFVVQQSEKWQKEKNTKLAFKYSLLRDYINSRLTLWMPENSQ